MRTFAPILFLAATLGIGCASKPPALVLKPESEKIQRGMQEADVEAIAGKPQMNFNDPASGAAMWMYKNDETGEHMTITFNMEGVDKVKYGAS